MSATPRERRTHRKAVEERVTRQRLAREREAREAEIRTEDMFERDRELARITISVYGQLPLSPPFYLRHIGLEDVTRGSTARQPSLPLPPVLSTRRKP
ncbi:hypothetical protein [Deinococcus aquiradiocola]|uniref:Uncharacterized protein n=1 Tax=Deinococcus aquiradiocola TaxID=393059 RepID=A0A917UKZ3_9DEIO|nr:hypothetical protein [Deinococcus aquiradiocola]GGJ65207.1 hypothetical protein GCM10008939_06400 [Deinococcus aquiradiocola]